MIGRGLGIFLLGLFLAGCRVQSQETVHLKSGPTSSTRWVLVEKRYSETQPGGRSGDGRLDPDARVLVFQAIEEPPTEIVITSAKNKSGGAYIELVSLVPRGRARPGEIVTATLRVGRAKPGSRYEVQAIPTNNQVSIIGTSCLIVGGHEQAEFRFTSPAPGRFGIEIQMKLH